MIWLWSRSAGGLSGDPSSSANSASLRSGSVSWNSCSHSTDIGGLGPFVARAAKTGNTLLDTLLPVELTNEPFIIPSDGSVGCTAAQWRTAVVAAPQLQKPISFAHIEGRLAEIEPYPTGIRATLDHLTIANLSPEETPARIKVRMFKGTEGLVIGGRGNFRVVIS